MGKGCGEGRDYRKGRDGREGREEQERREGREGRSSTATRSTVQVTVESCATSYILHQCVAFVGEWQTRRCGGGGDGRGDVDKKGSRRGGESRRGESENVSSTYECWCAFWYESRCEIFFFGFLGASVPRFPPSTTLGTGPPGDRTQNNKEDTGGGEGVRKDEKGCLGFEE